MATEAVGVQSKTNRVDKFCKLVGKQDEQTGKEYRWRLGTFETFLTKQLGVNIEGFLDRIGEFDVYEVLSDYHLFLSDRRLSPGTIKGKLQTTKAFLEYSKIPISNTLYRLQVRAPRRTRNIDLVALGKDTVRRIILGIEEIRLHTYCILLAATGMRANEALSIRVKDIDWRNKKVALRAEFTKTKRGRYCYLTEECINHLKSWKEYRERKREIVILGGKTRYKVKRTFQPDDLFFDTGHHKHQVT